MLRIKLHVLLSFPKVWRNFFGETVRANNLLRRDVSTSRDLQVVPEYFNRNPAPKLRHAIIGLPGDCASMSIFSKKLMHS
jgi:hypothetical protein